MENERGLSTRRCIQTGAAALGDLVIPAPCLENERAWPECERALAALEVPANTPMYVYYLAVKPLRSGLGGPLPVGAIEQIVAALGEVTTARVSHQVILNGFSREIPVRGDGLIDFSRDISSVTLVVKNRQLEQLVTRGDTFRKLTADEQHKTGKLWHWMCRCPYGDDDLWARIVAAIGMCALPVDDRAEVMNDEPAHRYSFLISPRRDKTVPAMALLYTHLRAHGYDRLTLHVWLTDNATVRKIRLHYSPVHSHGRVSSHIEEYVDFGIAVDLAAPQPDQVTGKPRRRRTHLGAS